MGRNPFSGTRRTATSATALRRRRPTTFTAVLVLHVNRRARGAAGSSNPAVSPSVRASRIAGLRRGFGVGNNRKEKKFCS